MKALTKEIKSYTRIDKVESLSIITLILMSGVTAICGIIVNDDKLLYMGIVGIILATIIDLAYRVKRLEKKLNGN